MDAVDSVLSPAVAAALVVLGTIRIERVPWWAAQWLADGHDGEALRELAGLDGQDPHAVTDLIPSALAEAGASLPSGPVAVASEAFRHIAEMYLSGQASERWIAQKAEEIVIQLDYDDDVMAFPLGQLYGVDDAWRGGWGPSVEELKAAVRAACVGQLQRDTPH
jgi:hypothetical protein